MEDKDIFIYFFQDAERASGSHADDFANFSFHDTDNRPDIFGAFTKRTVLQDAISREHFSVSLLLSF